MEEVIHQQFAKVDNLPKEISNLNAEFYLWKSVLPAATVVVFILVVFFYRFQKKNNTKFLQLSEKCVEFKCKILFLKCLFMQCDLLSFLINYFFVFFFSFLNGVYCEKSNLVQRFT